MLSKIDTLKTEIEDQITSERLHLEKVQGVIIALESIHKRLNELELEDIEAEEKFYDDLERATQQCDRDRSASTVSEALKAI